MDKDKKIAELEAEIARLQGQVNWLTEQIRLAAARRFGPSSEHTQIQEQLGIFNEAESVADPEPPEATPVAAHTRKQRGKRDELWEGIPVEQIVHDLPEDQRICPDCGGPLHACGHEVLRSEVELIPAKMRKIEHVQTVYSCRHCEADAGDNSVPMVKAHVPAPVIAGSGIASPSLVSYIICNKYALALPLYRQAQEFKRMGVTLSRQTMANWMIYASNKWLKPIYDILHEEMLRNDILHADETTVQVVKEDGRRASQKSYMWMYHTPKHCDRSIAIFEYQPTRQGEHPTEFLSDFKGYLHVDGYAGYKHLEQNGVTIVECWAHARRKFEDVIKSLKQDAKADSPANIGIAYCDKLFALERKYDEQDLSHDERKLQREKYSRKISDEFFTWAEAKVRDCIPKSLMGIAVRYALNQRQWLENYMLDGRLEMSNNRAERSIRPFTVGRKNWLFSFTPRGANASAVLYSIIETAYANGLVPFTYLKYLFETLPNMAKERYPEFLPWTDMVREQCALPAPVSSATV